MIDLVSFLTSTLTLWFLPGDVPFILTLNLWESPDIFLESLSKVAFCWAAWTLFCLEMELLPAAGYESRNSSSISSRKLPEEEPFSPSSDSCCPLSSINLGSVDELIVVVVVKASVVPSVSVVAGTLVVAEVALDIGAVSVVDDQPDVVLVPTVVLHSVAFDTVVVPNIVPKRIRKNLNQRSGFT